MLSAYTSVCAGTPSKTPTVCVATMMLLVDPSWCRCNSPHRLSVCCIQVACCPSAGRAPKLSVTSSLARHPMSGRSGLPWSRSSRSGHSAFCLHDFDLPVLIAFMYYECRDAHTTYVATPVCTCRCTFKDGKQPYSFLPSLTNLTCFLERGERIRQKDLPGCTDSMYAVLRSCWDAEPSARPTFTSLVEKRYTEDRCCWIADPSACPTSDTTLAQAESSGANTARGDGAGNGHGMVSGDVLGSQQPVYELQALVPHDSVSPASQVGQALYEVVDSQAPVGSRKQSPLQVDGVQKVNLISSSFERTDVSGSELVEGAVQWMYTCYMGRELMACVVWCGVVWCGVCVCAFASVYVSIVTRFR